MSKSGTVYAHYQNAKAGHYSVTLTALFRQKTSVSFTTDFTLLYPASVMEQRWDNAIAVLTAKYNGGYDFVAFQWYKNGQPLQGENLSYLYQPLDFKAEYAVLLTEANGTQMLSCPLIPTPHSDITLYPTIVTEREFVRCYVTQNATMQIFNTIGQLLTQQSLTEGETAIPMTYPDGVYFVKIHIDGTSNVETFKVIVR